MAVVASSVSDPRTENSMHDLGAFVFVQRNAARHALDRVDVEPLPRDHARHVGDVARRELTPQQRDDVAVLALHTHPCRVALLADGREADVDAQLRRFEEQLLHDGTRFVGGRLDQDSQRKRLMDIGLADVENEGVVARQDVRERRREAGLVLSGYVDLDDFYLRFHDRMLNVQTKLVVFSDINSTFVT